MELISDTAPVDLDHFADALRSTCGAFDVAPVEGCAMLKAHLEVSERADLAFTAVGQNADRIVRDRSAIRSDPADHFFLILQQEGRACMAHGDAETYLSPGDFFVVDSVNEAKFHYRGSFSSQLSLNFSRHEMQHRFGDDFAGGATIRGADALGAAMRSILTKVATEANPPAPHVMEAFFSVMGSSLMEQRDQAPGRLDPDRRIIARALTEIARHFRDPDFSSTDVAAKTGVSLRRLQRAFKVTEETPHQRLQRVRLEQSHQALAAMSDGNWPTISALAFDHGYNDLSTFYRQYRAHYGMTPKDATRRQTQ